MVTCPTVHGPAATVGQLRSFFRDSHMHAAVLADDGTLIGVVERADLGTALSDRMQAKAIAVINGRTIHPGARVDETLEAMQRMNQRRLAVVGNDGQLLGLLCLKASGLGFCSDSDVRSRKCAGVSPFGRKPA